MSIKLNIQGFEELLEDIQRAGGTIDRTVESSVKQSAQIMQAELKSEMKSVGVPSDLISAMPQFSVEQDATRISARVGFKKGPYDPNNLSDGYKALFLNYGTPRRSKHGKIEGKNFVEHAKKKAKPKIKKQEEIALEKILGRLKKK